MRTHDPLRDGGLRDQERARDLGGGEPAEQAQGQRHTRLGCEHWMAGRENKPQQVVAYLLVGVVDRCGRRRLELLLDLPGEILFLARVQRTPPQLVDRTMLRRRHEPGRRVVRYPRDGPLLERGHERILRELLGSPDVAHDAGEACDETRGFDAPDGFDCAVGVGGRHSHRSDHRRGGGAIAARLSYPSAGLISPATPRSLRRLS